MIALDTNLLVYAHREDSPFHAAAFECLQTLAESAEPWALPWPCVHECYGVITHPRVYNPPTTPARALAFIESLLESPSLTLLAEGPTHWSALRELLQRGRVAGPAVHDARIAALCLQHGVKELWSADRDFSRFPALKVVNPLI